MTRTYGWKNAATAGWTEERVTRLKELWLAGWSYSKIAADLGGGITRCSVAGKVRRESIGKRQTTLRFPTHTPAPPSRPPRSNLPRRVGQRKAPAPRPVVAYRPDTRLSDTELVQGWLAVNGGPRRFETGDSGDEMAMRGYLQERGYETAYSKGKLYLKGRGRPRLLTRQAFVAFVDDVRAAEGLPRIAA